MNKQKTLKLLFYLNLLVVGFLLGYKLYLNLSEPSFENLHLEQLSEIERELGGKSHFEFAVLGNINNSVGVFERLIIPRINDSEADFMISVGNAVSSGGEDKYRALQGSLSHLSIPYLLTFGENEYEDFGSFRFYEHFGPYFYNFKLAGHHFIFLDSTGKTPWRWQVKWLRELLESPREGRVMLFLGHPLVATHKKLIFDREDNYLTPPAFKEALLSLIEEHGVDAVFSANLPLFSRQVRGQTQFITTGGAGGLIANDDTSFYHYVRVRLTSDGELKIEPEPLKIGQNPILKRLESFWFFVYSLFYVGYINFILIISGLLLVALKLYQLLFVGKDYYPNFNLDPSPWLDRPLKVAMFTNNYLPFIGGVPISIERLRLGLMALGHQVLVVAPRYGQEQEESESQVLRLPSLLAWGKHREFRVANLFTGAAGRRLRAFKPDIIHLHHPFWLGSLGLWLGRRLGVPVVYTYHTRLEHYAHFVPLPGALFRNLISHALIKHFANRCDGVISPTHSTEDYLRMLGVKTPIYVQPTGIDYDRFQRHDPQTSENLQDDLGLAGKKVLVSVSRLSSEKNIDFLLDAMAHLKTERGDDFHLLIIGEGDERLRLEARIEQLELQRQVSLVGAVPPKRMADYYQLGDVFVFASKSETQGMVVLEAMAAGLPVVALRSSGIEDLVKDGENGYKTPENLSLWCQRLGVLLDDDALRSEFSGRARQLARNNATEAFAGKIRDIYAWVLAARYQEVGPDTQNTDLYRSDSGQKQG